MCSLKSYLNTPRTEKELLRIIHQLIQLLDEMYAVGYVHGDLDFNNIAVNEDELSIDFTKQAHVNVPKLDWVRIALELVDAEVHLENKHYIEHTGLRTFCWNVGLPTFKCMLKEQLARAQLEADLVNDVLLLT